MKAALLSAKDNLMEALVPLLKRDGRDYSTNLVVFPGKRPGHFLRKALAEKVGGSFIPPVIQSMDQFVDSVYETREGRPTRRLEPMDAVAILYDLQRRAPKAIGGQNFMSPDAFFPVGLKIYSDLEELYIEGVSPVKLKEVDPLTKEGIPSFTVERLQDLSFFYEEFYKSVRTFYSTRSLRYRTVSEEIDKTTLVPFDKIFFLGFFAFTGSEKKMCKKLFSSEKVSFIFKEGPGMERRLSELGIQREKIVDQDEKAPEIHFYQSPDTHGQVFSLAALLAKAQEEGTPLDEKTVIVLPSSDTLFPLFHQVLSLLGEGNWNISLGYPQHRTPVYGFLNSLMELVASMDGDRLYIPDYLRFILHPYTKNICLKENAEVTRILFHTLEEKFASERGQSFLRLSEIEEDAELFKEIGERVSSEDRRFSEEELRQHLKEIHENTITRFFFFQNVRDFSSRAIELLDFLFRRSTARLHPFFHPFTETLIQSLDALGRSLMGEMVFEKTTAYFTLFRRYILTCTTPFEGTPVKGVQILGGLETRNLSFDRVFILDVNEETLPGGRKEESLLPLRVREILGLSTYKDREELSAYYFENLWKGAREVHLFFVENDQKEKSRYIEQLLWEKQKRDRVGQPEGYFHQIQYRINLKQKERAEIWKTPEVVASLRQSAFSATALDTYLGCPLRFYYQYVLRLEKKEEASGEIERTEIGGLVHSILSSYFGKRIGQRLRSSDMNLAELDGLIEERFEEDYGKEPVGSIYLMKQQIKIHLRDFLNYYTLPLIRNQPVTILGVEHKLHTTFGGFLLNGRLDHIEKRGETIMIVDYKTSSNPESLRIRFDQLDVRRRETWREAIGSLQLPFYLLLYSEGDGQGIEALEAMFLLLGRAVMDRTVEVPLFDSPEGRREKFERLKMIMLGLLREIVDPGLPFLASLDLKTSCPTCDFRYLCGTQWLTR